MKKGIYLKTKFDSATIEVGVVCSECKNECQVFSHNSKDQLHFVCNYCDAEYYYKIKPQDKS